MDQAVISNMYKYSENEAHRLHLKCQFHVQMQQVLSNLQQAQIRNNRLAEIVTRQRSQNQHLHSQNQQLLQTQQKLENSIREAKKHHNTNKQIMLNRQQEIDALRDQNKKSDKNVNSAYKTITVMRQQYQALQSELHDTRKQLEEQKTTLSLSTGEVFKDIRRLMETHVNPKLMK